MSNLKSKFLLGVMTVAIMFVGVVALNADHAAAADCTITKTLRVGSKGAEVKCLQAAVGATADGSFGKKTAAAVKVWQAAKGLSADGVFGPKSRAVFVGGAVSGTFPAGCTSAVGFSPTTGASCATGVSNTQAGPLSVSLAQDNPASGYIVANQATADLAHFTFTGSGVLSSVVLQRTGVSDQNTLTNVYLYDGMTRLTDGYSFNNAGQLTITGLNLAINGTKTLAVKADVATATASSLGVTLVNYTVVGGTAVTVNIAGNQMTYGTGTLASVYLNNTQQTVTGTPTVNAGTSAYTVWSNPVQVNTRAVLLKGANFRMVGSAPADALQNIKLYVDGVAAGNVATMGVINGTNYAMFDFSASPVTLSTGSHTIDLRADVVKGASYTVSVSIQQPADLVIFDPQLGVNIAVLKASATTYVSSASGTITINQGSASVVVDPTFQSMTNVTGGATNVAIAKFKVHGYGEDVKVTTLSVLPVFTGTMVPTANGLNNLTVYFNGSQVGSSFNWTTGQHDFSLGSQMILPAGTDSYIEVRADLQTAASLNYTSGSVSANLVLGVSNAQGQSSHTTLAFPASTIVGNILAVQTGVLSVSRVGTNTTSNPNTANVKIGSFNLQNQSSSEAVRVTALAVSLFNGAGTALTASTSPALTNFSNLRTSETSGSGSTPVQPAATNTFSVDFTIAAGATKTIDIFADVSADSSSSTLVARLLVTSLGASSNVAISQNGNAVAVSGYQTTLVAGALTFPLTLVSSASTTGQFVPAAVSGAAGATKAEFNIAATNGSATISEMKFAVRGTATSSALNSVSSIAVGAVSAPVVLSSTNVTTLAAAITSTSATTLTLTAGAGVTAGTVLTIDSEDILVTDDTGGATVTTVTRGYNGTTAATHLILAPVTVKNGVAYLTGLNLVVPNGGAGLNVDAYVTYAPVGTNATPSMTLANISLGYLKYQTGGTTSTSCVSSLACTNTMSGAANDNVIAGPTMALVGSKPTITVATTSNAGLLIGENKLMDITVAADSHGDIKLNTLVFNLSTSSATMVGPTNSSAAVTRIAIGSTTVGGTTCTTNGSSQTSGSTSCAMGGYVIAGGTSVTFTLYGTTTGTLGASGTSSITTSLAASSNLSWTDVAGANAVAITGSDNTSYFYNYPTQTWSAHN
ncbi:MAG: peptidoglycan-binding domain-containing protein [Candidatus Paceibacterota bacterium]|jgi:hypothetical protein